MQILVHEVKENPDGSAEVSISDDKEIQDFVLKRYKRKRMTSKLLQNFVIEGLTNYMKSLND